MQIIKIFILSKTKKSPNKHFSHTQKHSNKIQRMLKTKHISNNNTTTTNQTQNGAHHYRMTQQQQYQLNFLPEKISKSVIKLHKPSNFINEIYDLKYLTLDSHSGSTSGNSSVSTSPNSLFSSYSCSNNCSNTNYTSQFLDTNRVVSPQTINWSKPQRGSITSNTSYESDVSSYFASDYSQQLTFQDFVSTIINSEDAQTCHELIVQDIARLLELNYRDSPLTPKFAFDAFNSSLFYKIAEKLFALAGEEPNGILGTRIKIEFKLRSGEQINLCSFFAYDAKTLATSEMTVQIQEDETKMKRFLRRCLINPEKFLSLKIDSNNFEIIKRKLYWSWERLWRRGEFLLI